MASARKPIRRRRQDTARVPPVLFVVCSTPSNPHADSPLEVFTQRRAAERAFRWSDQRLIEYVPRAAPKEA